MNNKKTFENALVDGLHDAEIFVTCKNWAKHRFVWISLSCIGIKISILDKDQEIKNALRELKNE
jgi:hypothetical protein